MYNFAFQPQHEKITHVYKHSIQNKEDPLFTEDLYARKSMREYGRPEVTPDKWKGGLASPEMTSTPIASPESENKQEVNERQEVMEKIEVTSSYQMSKTPTRPPRGIDSVDIAPAPAGTLNLKSVEDSMMDADDMTPPPVEVRSPVQVLTSNQLSHPLFSDFLLSELSSPGLADIFISPPSALAFGSCLLTLQFILVIMNSL